MKTDLVLDPRGAAVADMVTAARAADAGSWDTVWTFDHFSGLVSGGGWSRDPFVVLGAIAAVTERVHVGVLVANVVNRHPAQLASAVNSLQSLAPGRVWCGVGAGAARGSTFASEHDAIRRPLASPAVRRAVLAESIAALRALWNGDEFDGEHIHVDASMAVIDGAPIPPIIVGASSVAMIDVACAHADGVNLLPCDDLADRVPRWPERGDPTGSTSACSTASTPATHSVATRNRSSTSVSTAARSGRRRPTRSPRSPSSRTRSAGVERHRRITGHFVDATTAHCYC